MFADALPFSGRGQRTVFSPKRPSSFRRAARSNDFALPGCHTRRRWRGRGRRSSLDAAAIACSPLCNCQNWHFSTLGTPRISTRLCQSLRSSFADRLVANVGRWLNILRTIDCLPGNRLISRVSGVGVGGSEDRLERVRPFRETKDRILWKAWRLPPSLLFHSSYRRRW